MTLSAAGLPLTKLLATYVPTWCYRMSYRMLLICTCCQWWLPWTQACAPSGGDDTDLNLGGMISSAFAQSDPPPFCHVPFSKTQGFTSLAKGIHPVLSTHAPTTHATQ